MDHTSTFPVALVFVGRFFFGLHLPCFMHARLMVLSVEQFSGFREGE